MPFGNPGTQTIGPPPAAGIAQQQQSQPGPFAQASNMGAGLPNMGATPAVTMDPGALQGTVQVVKIHLENLLRIAPASAPWVQHAISDLETMVRTLIGQQQANAAPASSASPPAEPGAGLPI